MAPKNKIHKILEKEHSIKEFIDAWNQGFKTRPMRRCFKQHGYEVSRSTLWDGAQSIINYYSTHPLPTGSSGGELGKTIVEEQQKKADKKTMNTTPPNETFNIVFNKNGDGGTLEGVSTDDFNPNDTISRDNYIRKFNLNPDEIVVKSCKMRSSAWDVYDGRTLEAKRYSIDFEWKTTNLNIFDMMKWETAPLGDPFTNPNTAYKENNVFVLHLADLHVGKHPNAGGFGAENLEKIWAGAIRKICQEIAHRNPREIVVLVLGDLVEGWTSQNQKNLGRESIDLLPGEQILLATKIIYQIVEALTRFNIPLTIAAVGGNHGDFTRAQNFPSRDSVDTLIVKNAVQGIELRCEDIRDIDITTYYPNEEEAYVEVPTSTGLNLVAVHGDSFRGDLGKSAVNWWKTQIFNSSLQQSSVLAAGHYHTMHFSVVAANRYVIFSPAGGETKSQWLANSSGVAGGVPGVVCYNLNDDESVSDVTLLKLIDS